MFTDRRQAGRLLAQLAGERHPRGGRPDLAGARLRSVTMPTLLIAGSLDHEVLRLNEHAARQLGGPHLVVAIENASHLFN